jgi:hypothetical protein
VLRQVLQRGKPILLAGMGTAGELINISFLDRTFAVRAEDGTGAWKVAT